MPSKNTTPPSWQRRKDGDDVAVWVPREVRDRVLEMHETRGERNRHWTIADTWSAVVTKASRCWPWRARRLKGRS